MKTTRELLKAILGSLVVIETVKHESTVAELEIMLRKVQMFWNSERPLLLSNQN